MDPQIPAPVHPLPRASWLVSLRRLLGGSGPPAAGERRHDEACATPSPASAVPAAGHRQTPATAPGALAGDPGLRFSARTLGIDTLRARPIERTERESIIAIEHLALNPSESPLLPRLPAVLPKLMSLVRREDSSTRDVTENLGRDPTLIGEVIRIANSPRYRTGREIGDLQAAVLILGQRGLIQLLIQAAMRPIFECEGGRFTQADFSLPWRLSERCSHACNLLAADAGIDPFQAYLAGIVAHLGWVPALRAFSLSYRGLEAPDSIGFHEALVRAARRLSGQIARQWSFQPAVCEAVELASTDPLGELVRIAARLSQWHLLQPDPAASELAALPERERLCFIELQQAFAS